MSIGENTPSGGTTSGIGSGTRSPQSGSGGSGQSAADLANQARAAAHDARDAAASAASNAKDAAASAMGTARDAAGDMAASLQGQAEAAISSQKDAAADRVEEVAQAVRDSAGKLSGREEWLAGLITEGADELSSLAKMLRGNDLRALLGHVEDFARRQPTLFTGIAMVAGFAAARVAKSSGGHSHSHGSGAGGNVSGDAFNRSSSDRSMTDRRSQSGLSNLGNSSPDERPENYWAKADERNASSGMPQRGGAGTPAGSTPLPSGSVPAGVSDAVTPGLPGSNQTSGAGTSGTGTSGAASASPGATSYPGVLPQNKP